MDYQLDVLFEYSGKKRVDELALAVLEGLSRNPKRLPSKLFYDDKGTELFKAIMDLPEYYPTDCERETLESHKEKIASYLKKEDFNLVELGCGDGTKTLLLLNEFLEHKLKFQFVPLDISKRAIECLMENFNSEYGKIPFKVHGLVAEYFQGLDWITQNSNKRNLILFLGSNIGNFERSATLRFLRHLWYSLNDGDMVLIGFDLKKDPRVLHAAYNDSKGITSEFNLNVLSRINEDLGGNFDRKNFTHQGVYDVISGAMESYLISLERQEVEIEALGKSFSFEPWEPIHMEYSYKYLPSDIADFAASTGFEVVENFADPKNYFIDSLWKVSKST